MRNRLVVAVAVAVLAGFAPLGATTASAYAPPRTGSA